MQVLSCQYDDDAIDAWERAGRWRGKAAGRILLGKYVRR